MKFMASIERDAATERRGYSAFAIHHLILYLATEPECVHSMAMRPTSEAPANSPPACIDAVEPNAIPVAPVFGILFALSFRPSGQRHPAVVDSGDLPDFESGVTARLRHIGLITLTNQLTASLLATFRRRVHRQTSAAVLARARMASTLVGLVLLR